MQPTMGFKAVTIATTTTFWYFLTVFLLAVVAASNNTSLNITKSTSSPLLRTEPPSCVFPYFLQTDCTGSARVCEWNLGKRIALLRWNNLSPPSKFRALRGISEWTWTVVNSTITIKRSIALNNFQPLSRRTQSVFECITNRGLASNTFIISKKEVLGEKQDTNETYSCIRFIRRSENVIQYELASWNKSLKDVACQDNGLVLEENLLISDHSHGLLDCPLELQGAYEILHIYDAKKQRTCTYDKGSFGVLESDCLGKEGLYIDFGKGHNCTNPDIGHRFPSELNLRCISKEWKYGDFTYFVTARRDRWASDYEKTTLQCIRFKMTFGREDELTLTIFNDPICKGLSNNEEGVGRKGDMFSLLIRRKKKPYTSKYHPSSRCEFQNEMQGTWMEQSSHQGSRKIRIEGGNISISPYGSFECKERFTTSQGHPSVCGFGGEGDRWLGQGQVRFYYDDYALVSKFENGCRPRITRFGLTSTVNKLVLIYRLSQSEPFVDDGRSPEDFYRHEILKRFCGMSYLYQRDPYPYWGRNIEKVIHKEQLPAQTMSKCSLVLNSRHSLLSVIAGSESTSCKEKTSLMHFGCQKASQAMTFLKISYPPNCEKKEVTFSCIGKAWKFGNYVLLRDTVTQQINCFWFDKESNAIFRLGSSQCSDADWGRLPGHGNHFDERFKIKYFEKCPFVEPLKPTKGCRSRATFAVLNQILWLLPLILLTRCR